MARRYLRPGMLSSGEWPFGAPKMEGDEMLLIAALLAVVPGEITGFWHSEPDLSDGYGSCWFFWDDGRYAHLESLEEGVVYIGDWYVEEGRLVLAAYDAMGLDGNPLSVEYAEYSPDISLAQGKEGRMDMDGEVLYRISDDPEVEIYSLVPTWGMNYDERDVFSTYD